MWLAEVQVHLAAEPELQLVVSVDHKETLDPDCTCSINKQPGLRLSPEIEPFRR